MGLETTPGTGVAASKLMSSMVFDLGPEAEFSEYRPSGGKFNTIVALNREWAGASISGPANFNEIVYPLNSVLRKVTPSGAGAAKTYVMSPAQSAADPIATYTLEVGSALRAQKMEYSLFTAFGILFSMDGCTIDGELIGMAMEDAITLTPTPTTLAQKVILPRFTSVKHAATSAGLTAALPMGRLVSAEWRIANRFGPVWVLNQTTSFAAHVELPVELELVLRHQADAEGMAFLPFMRSGETRFIRMAAISDEEIEASSPYKLQIDTAAKVKGVSRFEDEEGQTVLEWTMAGVFDSGWGKATEVTVVNNVATL